MHVLFTESSPNIGGQELQALEQMSAFKKEGHNVALACRGDSKIAQSAREKGIAVFPVAFRNSLHIPSIFRLLHVIKKFTPEVIICHSGHDSNIAGIACRLSFLRPNKPCLIRQKTYTTRRIKTFSLNYLNDLVIVPSLAIKEQLVQAGCHGQKIHVVHPGFDFNKIEKDSELPIPDRIRSWLNDSGDAKIILQVGMLRDEKAHDFMLNALSRLKSNSIKFRFIIAGGGTPEAVAKIESQITLLGLQDNVFIAGNVFPVMPLYKLADLVVMPSRNESFGMTVVEASFFAVPVIASKVGGIPEVIQDNISGTLLPVGDEDAWVSALTSFFVDGDDFKRMSAIARRDMINHFSIEQNYKNIVSLVNQHNN